MRAQRLHYSEAGEQKERLLLTETNRTKLERSNHLDREIQRKESQSKSFDNAIKVKNEQINQLDRMADDKVREIYTLKERGDWQSAMLRALSAYMY